MGIRTLARELGKIQNTIDEMEHIKEKVDFSSKSTIYVTNYEYFFGKIRRGIDISNYTVYSLLQSAIEKEEQKMQKLLDDYVEGMTNGNKDEVGEINKKEEEK